MPPTPMQPTDSPQPMQPTDSPQPTQPTDSPQPTQPTQQIDDAPVDASAGSTGLTGAPSGAMRQPPVTAGAGISVDSTGGDTEGDPALGGTADDDPAVDDGAGAAGGGVKKRRRGSRGGKNRKRPAGSAGEDIDDDDDPASASDGADATGPGDPLSAAAAAGAGEPHAVLAAGEPAAPNGAAARRASAAPDAPPPRPGAARAPRAPRASRSDAGAGVAGAGLTAADLSGADVSGAGTGGAVTGGVVTGGAVTGGAVTGGAVTGGAVTEAAVSGAAAAGRPSSTPDSPELPERLGEGRPSAEAAERALVRRPQIGDTRPAPPPPPGPARPARGPGALAPGAGAGAAAADASTGDDKPGKKRRRGAKVKGASSDRSSGGRGAAELLEPVDDDVLERRRGRERNGRPVGRYLMCVQVRPTLTQVAVLEGRNLIEHYVSRPADDISQIHGNIYLGKVQNVLPGMEAAFVDIGTPKNAVLYRGDVQYDAEDIVEKGGNLRIEQMLKPKQLIICQVTKNPIGAKGARLTQEVSLPGRFVVLIPNSKTYGISKRLPDEVRKRLRSILDRVKPAEHGLIVRTAAEHATEHELRADMTRLLDQWAAIESKAKRANTPTLLYREPQLAVRVIREEFNAEYRGVVIDDRQLYEDVKDYIGAFNPELADRVEFFDADVEGLPIFEHHHVHEQLHKALDRKVWLPSGGSLIIEHTEALTVIDVNTGKNVGTSNLEETVFRNNLEAAVEVAKQLRLRDIGGIVVIDFIDMEIRENRKKVVDAFRQALARDKTRTQVFDISELGLVEMTRKRIGEGLLTNFADQCPNCEGRGVVIDHALLV